MQLRSMRRDRAARGGVELFLYERAFADCLERLVLLGRRFASALLIGCPDAGWRTRLGAVAESVAARDPGPLFASSGDCEAIVEDEWQPPESGYDLVVAIGTLDTVNNLPLALRLIRFALARDGLLIGAISGGETLPQLRSAMRAADVVAGAAAPHVHPRIEAAALAPLLAEAGFVRPVVDIDRAEVTYRSLSRLVGDLRAMGVTNVLRARAAPLSRQSREAAIHAFAAAGEGRRTRESFELLHFAGWTAKQG